MQMTLCPRQPDTTHIESVSTSIECSHWWWWWFKSTESWLRRRSYTSWMFDNIYRAKIKILTAWGLDLTSNSAETVTNGSLHMHTTTQDAYSQPREVLKSIDHKTVRSLGGLQLLKPYVCRYYEAKPILSRVGPPCKLLEAWRLKRSMLAGRLL